MRATWLRYSWVGIVSLALIGGCGQSQQPEIGTLQRGLTVPLENVAKKTSGVYIVRLADQPAAVYDGSVAGFAATKPAKGQKYDASSKAAAKYIAHLAKKQQTLLATVGATKGKFYSYVHSFNGFAAVLTPQQAAQLAASAGVVSVKADSHHKPTTETSPTFLGLDAPGGLWSQLGGQGASGENVIVGVIDTGIWPEHPSFSDQVDLVDRPGESGKATRVYGPPPAHWKGRCQSGERWSQDDCNNKLIGARYFLEGFGHHGVITKDFKSARDASAHGTHTASTAAGNWGAQAQVLGQNLGMLSGMAPRARIAMYKACWNDEGCYGTDLVAAIDQAVADGVDVINYSIGSDTPNLVTEDTIAFLFAADAGVFVAASAGNAGPGAGTIGTPATAPWVTSVGASTHSRDFQGTATLGDGNSYAGASITKGTASLPLVDAADAGDALCAPGALNPAAVSGKIVLCLRGVYARVDKSWAVALAGGAGMILYTPNDEMELVADMHSIPSVHINFTKGAAIKTYISTAAAPTAQLSGGTATTVPAPVMAAFSSRGPNGALADLIKPDVTAPGVNILAGTTPEPMVGVAGQLYQTMSGTSMSSPHVAGLGALLKQRHPDWSAAMIKSALMTTALQNTKKEDGVTPADPFDFGAGHVNPNGAADPGLVYDANIYDYLAFLCGSSAAVDPGFCAVLQGAGYSTVASDLNLASIGISQLVGEKTVWRGVTNVGSAPATYNASVQGLAGISATVSPATLTLQPGQTAWFSVTFTAQANVNVGAWAFGSLTWSDGTHNVRSPIAIKPLRFAAPAQISGSGAAGSASFGVSFGYTGAFSATGHGPVAASLQPGSVVDDPANDINVALGTGVGIAVHYVNVPAGSAFARFSLFDAYTDGADDLDLYVFDGTTGAFVGGSGSGSSAEEVSVSNPPGGWYIVVVHGWQTDGADANYTLFSWAVPNAAGALTVNAPGAATLGQTAPVDVGWAGLAADTKYLGVVQYNGPNGQLGQTVVKLDN